jgi:hypothetical protein
MEKQKIGTKKKHTKRGRPAKIVELKSSLSNKMSKMVCHFDLAYMKLKSEIYDTGLFSTPEGRQEAEVLIEKAQQAVQDFSTFMSEFCKEVGFEYHPPKNIVAKKLTQCSDEDNK